MNDVQLNANNMVHVTLFSREKLLGHSPLKMLFSFSLWPIYLSPFDANALGTQTDFANASLKKEKKKRKKNSFIGAALLFHGPSIIMAAAATPGPATENHGRIPKWEAAAAAAVTAAAAFPRDVS